MFGFKLSENNSDTILEFEFEAYYKHNDTSYPHPYTLRRNVQSSLHYPFEVERSQQISYEISLYLELKRLRDFNNDDLKRYCQAIDNNINRNEEVQDFHELYLNFRCLNSENPFIYPCNNGRPILLPKLISNPWTSKNTLTRFRYDAEKREGAFHCEMTLRCGNNARLPSYRIVLCLISNMIPARMDYHAIRWICKLKSRTAKQNGASARNTAREKVYCLSHSSGIIVADVYGPELKFTPKLFNSINNANYVRSCFEQEDFQANLANSDSKDNGTLAILVTKSTDYPQFMKDRRKNQNILRYLPFNELDDLDNNFEISNSEVMKRLKIHKEKRVKQLFLFAENERETFSQEHVRLYAAAYGENDILLAETLHPPLRNSKAFETLRIMRIVQPKHELKAKDPAYVYCNYDFNQAKTDYHVCPFQFELVFIPFWNTISDERLVELFKNPHICVQAEYVIDCPCLLQFTVPNEPKYHEHRIFIRLRHMQSNDYNPSSISLTGRDHWIYYADSMTVTDLNTLHLLTELDDPWMSNLANSDHVTELRIQSQNDYSSQEDLTYDQEHSDEDADYFNSRLDTPDPDIPQVKRFAYSPVPSFKNNTE
ncbi:hypothetical protein I4U23_028479 [Adineta vaga]|nr:hypothetical protein I4U23_028479 [Adineta vaga]